MTMPARYAGTCRMCGGAIAVGETIAWTKGEGARHTACERSLIAAPARQQRTTPRPARRLGVTLGGFERNFFDD